MMLKTRGYNKFHNFLNSSHRIAVIPRSSIYPTEPKQRHHLIKLPNIPNGDTYQC